MKDSIPCKRVIVEILDYLKFKVLNDDCTPAEIRSFANVVEENLDINCTAQDLANYYGQSQSNVRNVLSRNFMPKPKRKTYYSFSHFLKFIPKSWRRATS